MDHVSINNIPTNLIFYTDYILPETDLFVLYRKDYINEFENKN